MTVRHVPLLHTHWLCSFLFGFTKSYQILGSKSCPHLVHVLIKSRTVNTRESKIYDFHYLPGLAGVLPGSCRVLPGLAGVLPGSCRVLPGSCWGLAGSCFSDKLPSLIVSEDWEWCMPHNPDHFRWPKNKKKTWFLVDRCIEDVDFHNFHFSKYYCVLIQGRRERLEGQLI
jgi:hypothetical protein